MARLALVLAFAIPTFAVVPALTPGQSALLISQRYDPAAVALFARMTATGTAPDAVHKAALNKLIVTLKSSTAWNNLDVLCVAGATQAHSLLNLKGATYNASASGSLTFASNQSLAGNGTNSYVNTNWYPGLSGRATQNAWGFGVFVQDDFVGGDIFAGAVSGAPNQWTAILGMSGGTVPAITLYSDLNRTSAGAGGATAIDSRGLIVMQRVSSSSVDVYHRGSKIGTVSSTSLAFAGAVPLTIGAYNNFGTPTGYNVRKFGGWLAGAPSASDMPVIASAVQTYLKSVSGWYSTVAAWGDSITAGAAGQTPYPTLLRQAVTPNRATYNGGVSGNTSTDIKTRMLAGIMPPADITLIEAGRNNFGSPTTVMADIASMVAAVPNGKYLVFTVSNATDEPTGNGNRTQIDALNAQIRSTYPSNYFDLQALLNNGGDTPNPAWMYDNVHPNTLGNTQISNNLQTAISARGW